MKQKISAKKFFVMAIPSSVIYRVIAFFTLDRLLSENTARLVDFILIVIILFTCLYLAKKASSKKES